MILDVPLPGIEPWEEVNANPLLWHVNFHQTPGLPEKLVTGRQTVYFKHFFDIGTVNKRAISDTDVAHYVNSYSTPAQLRAGFELYRALPVSGKFNAAQRSANDLPIVLAGGDHSFGDLLPKIATSLKALGCSNVTIEIIKNSGHYLFDEQPEIMAELIERYASR